MTDLATRSFLRAGQLMLASNALDAAVEYFGRALSAFSARPNCHAAFRRSEIAQGRRGKRGAVAGTYGADETEYSFLRAVRRSAVADRAAGSGPRRVRRVLQAKAGRVTKNFELAAAYMRIKEDVKAAALMVQTKETMRALRKENEFATQADRLATTYPDSLPVAEVVSKLYEELNRETKYFDALVRLFDLYLVGGSTERCVRIAGPAGGYRSLRLPEPGTDCEAGREGGPGVSAKYYGAGGEGGVVFDANGRIYRRGARAGGEFGGGAGGSARAAGAGRSDRAGGNIFAVFAAEQSGGAAGADRRTFSGRGRKKRAAARVV